MSSRHVFPDRRFAVARRLLARSDHLYDPTGIRSVISSSMPLIDLSETAIPCHIVTTDLIAGVPTWWTEGDPLEVLSASACLPGIFPPVRLGESLHVDGGVSCPVPTQRALDLGAARVWVLNVSRNFHGWAAERMSALDVLLESFAISRSHLGRLAPVVAAGQLVAVLPALAIGRHDIRDFSQTPRLIAAGREAGRAMVVEQLRVGARRPLAAVADPGEAVSAS
jgi:NTE family protein